MQHPSSPQCLPTRAFIGTDLKMQPVKWGCTEILAEDSKQFETFTQMQGQGKIFQGNLCANKQFVIVCAEYIALYLRQSIENDMCQSSIDLNGV